MPLISIPVKASETYLKMCMNCYRAKNRYVFEVECVRAHSYAEAIKDICGIDVWGEIVRAADMQLPDGVEACCGIPFNPEKNA
jgi:hypothetical protein